MIKKLEWDSSFFGFNIAELNIMQISNKFDIEPFIVENNIKFIQARCNISNTEGIRLLEENSFHYADLRVTFQIQFKEGMPYHIYELANNEDINTLKKIAANSFTDSRYYGYEHIFLRGKIDELYETWVEKSVKGLFDDCCLKITVNSKIAGFLTLRIRAQIATIGIIAIDEKYQGNGVGTQLMNSLMGYLAKSDIEFIEVTTQGKNIKAQNFYIKNGFRLKELESWYYWLERK
ncbi:Acetyltransferase (GNAT) family protein [Paenibacillus sp. 1_12]|uniref:GNAT family N-acetyltransferase n=1 Tax=Paenibacillus sp. 1_12 TaxID=1566278 RepID=UPI0008F44E63|nr:GNAT family N-acetyltransferase [Paenibacillus sp. 1_12]SFM13059.1 Acetyltransferase (GNAT) family protein [Paenibacillus sp. 1_12]